jgi:lysozyme family protein
MNLAEQLRYEISRSINTLRRRYANTADKAEKKAIVRAIDALNAELSELDGAALLVAAATLCDAAEQLEKVIASVRKGPFDGYLAAMEEHLCNFYALSGEMHAAERLQPALNEEIVERPRTRSRGRARRRIRGLAAPLPLKDYAALKDEYQAYYDACQVRSEHKGNVAYYVKRLNSGRAIYEEVGHDLGRIPWVFIGITHGMECGFNFACHMHNGDPLTARTTCVPAGRPAAGSPPFTWRQSAVDAMTFKRFHEIADWPVPRMLYLLEKYNGFGYRTRQVPTPYLWSFSTLYDKGKFVSDGRFDPNAVSKQCGAALMLKAVLGG